MLQLKNSEQRLNAAIRELEALEKEFSASKFIHASKHSRHDFDLSANRDGLIFLSLQLLKAANMKVNKVKTFTTDNKLKNNSPSNFKGKIQLLSVNDRVELILKRNFFTILLVLLALVIFTLIISLS